MKPRIPRFQDLAGLIRTEIELPRRMRWTLDAYVSAGYECRVIGDLVVEGAVWFQANDGRLEIAALAVVAAFRGGGRGRALMESAHQWGRERGLRKAFLDVLDDNTAARLLYSAMGYVNVGRPRPGVLRMQVAL